MAIAGLQGLKALSLIIKFIHYVFVNIASDSFLS